LPLEGERKTRKSRKEGERRNWEGVLTRARGDARVLLLVI
jgi:hypothetical protein